MPPMDLDDARFLAADGGFRLLEAARTTRELPAHRRAGALAECGTPDQVRLALQQDDLRVKALARCPHAERLLFTPEALEQATAWPVAEERATRWHAGPDEPLHDLGAGIGMDSLATALRGRPVVAYEQDPVRATLLAHNARALDLAVDVRTADLRAEKPGGALALLDPDRRPGGRRTRDRDAFEPPRDTWAAITSRFERAMIKLPPTATDEAEAHPFEVVSLHGRARERRLFTEGWALPPRRALALPSGRSVEGAGARWPDPVDVKEGDWILDPDTSVVLAGLVGDLALRDGLQPVHPEIAYLVGAAPNDTAPGHWVRVDAVLSPHPKKLKAWLRAHAVGNLTIRKRGVATSVEKWRRLIQPKGKNAATLVIARDVRDRWVAYGCRGPDAAG